MVESIENFYLDNNKIDEKGNTHLVSASSLRKEESYALYSIIKKYKPVKTLEVGLSLGGSAVAIIAGKVESNISEKHIALDPYQKSYGNNAGLVALRGLGMEDRVDHVSAFSEQYLNKMHIENNNFDFIFIDGHHSIGQAVTDAFLADKILNNNGIIGVHDSLLFSTAASIRYLVIEKKYKIITNNNVSFKNMLRQVKYLGRLGIWYCTNVIPQIHMSIIFLQKNEL